MKNNKNGLLFEGIATRFLSLSKKNKRL